MQQLDLAPSATTHEDPTTFTASQCSLYGSTRGEQWTSSNRVSPSTELVASATCSRLQGHRRCHCAAFSSEVRNHRRARLVSGRNRRCCSGARRGPPHPKTREAKSGLTRSCNDCGLVCRARRTNARRAPAFLTLHAAFRHRAALRSSFRYLAKCKTCKAPLIAPEQFCETRQHLSSDVFSVRARRDAHMLRLD